MSTGHSADSKIFFLDPITEYPTKTTRKHELQHAAARSHASKVAHRIRRHRTRSSTQTTASAKHGPFFLPPGRENAVSRSATSICPGFGSFRSEMLDLCKSTLCDADSRALDFMVNVHLPGIDVANEMFDDSGLFCLLLPNLASELARPAIMAQAHLLYNMYNELHPIPRQLMLEHRGRAIKQVRKFLDCDSALDNEGLILAIAALATIEAALGDSTAYRFYMSALKVLSETRGNLRISSGSRVQDIVALYSDTTSALSTGRSVFERPSFKPIPIDWPHCVKCQPILERVPTGFTAVLYEVPVSEDVISVLARACHLGFYVPCCALTQSQRWSLASRRQSARRHLNYLDSVPVLLAPDESGVNFEKMLVLALSVFAWCGFNLARLPHFAVYKVIKQQLYDRLLLFRPVSGAQRQCAAWMWLMVIDSWRTEDRDKAVTREGLNALSIFRGKYPEYDSWAATQNLTRSFFWTRDMENFWSRNWEMLRQPSPSSTAISSPE